MNLQDLCEPLFQFLCFLNRTHRKGGHLDHAEVKGRVKELFRAMRGEAGRDALLSQQFEHVQLPLVFFVDSMIAEAQWSISDAWHQDRLAYDPTINERGGDEKFFAFVEQELGDLSPASTERLLVLATCLGMGFKGWLVGREAELKQVTDRVLVRIQGNFVRDAQGRLCPESYQHVDTRNLIEPPSRSLLGIAVAVAGLAVVLVVVNLVMYQYAFRDVKRALGGILDVGSAYFEGHRP